MKFSLVHDFRNVPFVGSSRTDRILCCSFSAAVPRSRNDLLDETFIQAVYKWTRPTYVRKIFY